MVRHLGSALTDLTYVFDEPTYRPAPARRAAVQRAAASAARQGEHRAGRRAPSEVIAIADHVVDLGPGAGIDGGTITYEGDVAGLRSSTR
jgi:excinuclease UvrABC ATPase subunit